MKQFALIIILAIATLFLLLAANHVAAVGDLCAHTTHKQLCRALVKGNQDPTTATLDVTRRLLKKTKNAKVKANGLGKDGDKCREAYDVAIDSLTRSLVYFKKHDKITFKGLISNAINHYSNCDDSYEKLGKVRPLSKWNGDMTKIADTVLELYKLVP